jgi:hypothetical protein
MPPRLRHGKPPYFCEFRAEIGLGAMGGVFHPICAAALAGRTSPPARFEMNMTASVTQSPTPTAFDWALFSAVACGWDGRAAFDAVCVMKASGMTESQIELAFLDCRKRVQ